MSKKSQKKDSRQMELNFPKSSQGAFPASRLASREQEKEQVTTDISGQKCFESSKSLNRGGLLEKMCEALLTSKTAWSSKLCALTWKEKDTKSGRSIFQLQVSALPTEEKEFGLWRTPDAASGGSNLPGIQKALDQGHLKRPSGQAIQIRLADQVKEPRLWPTPTQDSATERTKKYNQGGKPLTLAVKEQMWPTPQARLERQFGSKLQGTRERFTHGSQTINGDVANADGERQQKQWGSESIQEKVSRQTTGTRSECESGWSVEPDVGRVAHGIPGRVHRLKALGNSIVPQIAEEIGRAIIKAENEN